MELKEIVAFSWSPTKAMWHFTPCMGISCVLKSHGNLYSVEEPLFNPYPDYSETIPFPPRNKKIFFTGAIKYLDEQQRKSLLSPFPVPFDFESQRTFAGNVIEFSKLKWPSIRDALASMRRIKPPKKRSGKSIFRRLISSLFKKKPKPVTA